MQKMKCANGNIMPTDFNRKFNHDSKKKFSASDESNTPEHGPYLNCAICEENEYTFDTYLDCFFSEAKKNDTTRRPFTRGVGSFYYDSTSALEHNKAS